MRSPVTSRVARAPKLLMSGLLIVGLALLPIYFAPSPADAQSRARVGPESIASIAENLMDAVVSISTTQAVKGTRGAPLPRVPQGSPFQEFFDDFFKDKGSSRERTQRSLGSGFVIDANEGLIVTNNHVIEGADEITANFSDGRKLKVDRVLGRDAKSDLALLKVTPGRRPLKAVKFGASHKMRVGDWVMAIGNPFGLGGSLSVGVISAKQRDINAGPYDDFLQTDAAINRGNSGGPLFNLDGEVIGVNTAIISPTGGSIGIGFAVPSDNAVGILEQLRQFGEARRGWLGVRIRSISEDLQASLNIEEGFGALIEGITPGGPAEAAGIRNGDVVLKFDGKEITSVRGLPRIVAQTPVGKEVDVELIRDKATRVIKVVVGRLQEDEKPAEATKSEEPAQPGSAQRPEQPPTVPDVILGLKLAPLGDAERKTYGFRSNVNGVVITEVEPDSEAAKKGLRAGDLIVEAQSEQVTTPADLFAALERVKQSQRRAILLRVEDNKNELRYVAVPIR